jgi:hypothetical protein
MNPQAESNPDIVDIVAPQAVLDPVFVAGGILLALLIGAVIVFTVFHLFRDLMAKHQHELRRQFPHEEAARALDKLAARMDALSPNEFMVGTSNVVKRYLLDRYHDPVLFETAEEFLDRDNIEKPMPSSKRRAVGEFLSGCEIIKFARFPEARAQCAPLLEVARKIVREAPSSPPPPLPSSPQTTVAHG